VKKSFIRKTMFLFITIGLAPFLLFTLFFVNKANEIEQERVEESLSTIVEEKASALQKDLKNIENETVNLSRWAVAVMSRQEDGSSLPQEYLRDERNVLGREPDSAEDTSRWEERKSNIFLPADVSLTPELIKEIKNSEGMEVPMAGIREQTPDVTYTYMVTAKGLLRVFPYLSNEAFDPNHDQRSDYFYTRAVTENPNGKAVWTNPYYDYGGNGWIITCSSPFYLNGELGGVVCVDVSLKTLAASIADFRIGDSGFAFVITEEGDVVYHPDMMDIISERGNRLQTNLLSNRNAPQSYRRIINDMIQGKRGVDSYQSGGPQNRRGDPQSGSGGTPNGSGGTQNGAKTRTASQQLAGETKTSAFNLMVMKDYKIVAYTPVETLGWSIGVEVGKSEYSVGSEYLTFGFWSLTAALLAASIALAYSLSRRVTQPIRRLTEDVKRIGEGEFRQVEVTSEDEIGLLGDAFNRMSREIRDYTATLIYGKSQMETVLNSIGGVMMILKPDYSISMMNEEGLKQLGRKDLEQSWMNDKTKNHANGDTNEHSQIISNMKCYALLCGQDSPCSGCPVKATLEQGKISESEVIRYQNIYKISSYPVYGESGGIQEVVVHSRKITEQVMMERELFQSEKMAGVGQMVAGVTHELKNPLAVIKGAIYLWKANQGKPDKQEDAMAEINESVARAEKIIYNMLDFSRTSWAEKEQISVRSLLEQILLLVRQEMVKRRINVSFVIEEEPLWLYGNADSFKHIFLNIITNAIDAMPKGGDLRISAKRLRDEMVELVFSNTGERIPMENLNRIFQPFFTTKEKGTGLGLWIVSKEVSRNGGTIQAYNDDMTRIRIVLPGKELSDE
jgi:signal transduction histidine kinase